MAAPSRPQDPDVAASPAPSNWDEVLRHIRSEPFRFRFFQAVSLLERIHGGPQLGEFGEPSKEAVRFGGHASLSFPASEIQALEWEHTPPRMRVNFMGLQGQCGVLPYSYTQLIEDRTRTRDNTLRDWLDIFNHRFLSLFYRAWKRYRLPIDPARTRDMVFAVIGLGTKGLTARQSVEDESLAFYGGLLGMQPRSAGALERMLEDYFRVPVEVEQFMGGWYTLSADALCRFEERETASECLGMGVVVGDEVWDQQSRVRVKLGPMSRERYEEFLPGRAGFTRLRELTRFYARDQIDFEAQLILQREDVPGCKLDEEPVQLGWTTWMKSKPVFGRDAGDTVLDLRTLS